jgi:hypothetical protein
MRRDPGKTHWEDHEVRGSHRTRHAPDFGQIVHTSASAVDGTESLAEVVGGSHHCPFDA